MIAVSRFGHAHRPRALHLALMAALAAGCAEGGHEKNVMTDPTGAVQSGGVTPTSAPRSSAEFARANTQGMGGMGGMGGGSVAYASAAKSAPMGGEASKVQLVEVYGNGEAATPDNPKTSPAMNRKILYTADIDLVTENLSKLEIALLRLVKQNDGYIADSDISGDVGSSRTARWKIRIPIEKFDSFLESSAKLGELTRRKLNSQDVSEEYYDLESRIKNKKVEETRLLKHLQDSTAKLEDILAAEKELSRVREEVERQEGRLRMLANLTSLTTVTINASERTEFVPATAPVFTTRVGRAFSDSATGMMEFFQFLTIWVSGNILWLPFWLIAVAIVLVIYRRVRRRVVALIQRPRPSTP